MGRKLGRDGQVTVGAHVTPTSADMTRALTQIVALAGGTLVSEDLTCVAAGQLVHLNRIHTLVAITGCVVGIYAGDLGLWLAGRTVGRQALRWSWLRRRI